MPNETFTTDFETFADAAPQDVDAEVVAAQSAINELDAFLASDDPVARENRPTLARLVGDLNINVGSLLDAVDAACA